MSYVPSFQRAAAISVVLGIAATAMAEPPTEKSLLPVVIEQNRLISAAIRAQVQEQLATARRGQDPASAVQDLKLASERVARAPELDAATRAVLRSQLEAAIRETSRRAEWETQRAQHALDQQAAARERQQVLERVVSGQGRLQQLLDRFNSLLDEGRYNLAESAGTEIESTLPNSALASSTRENVRLTRSEGERLATRHARQQGIVGTLAQCEVSAVPQPDDEPMVYPAAAVWEALSQRRRKFARVDMRTESPAEAKIYTVLEETTDLSFLGTPLEDVAATIKDLHGVEVQIDERALEESGLGRDLPVTRTLQGISLRSALRLMLAQLDLTYVVKNEVIVITTPEEAGRALVTRVYPVGELVVPIRTPNFTGGFGQLGGTGDNPFSQGGGQNGMNPGGQNPFGQNPGPGFF